MMIRTILGAACAALALAAFVPAAAQTPAASLFGRNLVVNGNAEADTGSPDATQIVKPSDWTTTGQFTVVQYGASGGFPDKSAPGPADRGKNFFAGGNAALSTATQTIDLSSGAEAIDAGSVTYALSGWLGGYSNQDDDVQVTVAFLNESGGKLSGSAQVGPLKAADRKGVTGIFLRSTTGAVPAHARSARVTLTVTRYDGEYNDGYSDDISLVLKKKGA
jgi:hypothetical protein